MSNEVAVLEQQSPSRAVSVFDGPVQEFRSALARRGDNRKALIDWVRQALVESVDFGKIHYVARSKCDRGNQCTNPNHFSKPVLFKPGAEKICGMLGVTPTFPTMKEYEQMALDGKQIASIIMRCHILSADDKVVADGIGARSVEQDYGDLNKALKMACKSGMIDATLRMAGLSEIFTQDLEDMAARDRAANDQGEHGKEATTDQSRAQAPQSNGGERVASDKQVKLIRVKLDQAGISPEDACKQFNVESLTQLPFESVNDVLAWVQKHGT